MMKKMFMTMAAAVAVTAAFSFGAAAAEDQKIEAGGLVFEIPDEYKDLVTVQTEDLQPDELIRVSETASIEAAKANGENPEGAGWLFSISRIPEEELKRLRCGDMSGSEPFAEDDGFCYIYNHPTDVRLVRDSYDDIESKLGAWTELNEWAGRDVRRDILKDNPQLDEEHCSNTALDIYLAQAAYQGKPYEIRSLELMGTQPAVCDGTDYLEDLTEDVWYEEVTDFSGQDQPDGEYIVMAFDEDGVRFDFFLGSGLENYVREVMTLDDDETMETIYRAHFDDPEESSTGIMKEWIAEMKEDGSDSDGDVFDAPADPESESAGLPDEEESFPAEIADETTIRTPYYSITAPDSWAGKYIVKSKATVTGLWLELYSKEIYESEGYGHLFSIVLTEDEDYKMIADHELLGDLTDQEGRVFHAVASFPTDVQYPRDGRDSYTALAVEAENILGTFEAADGCVFVKE